MLSILLLLLENDSALCFIHISCDLVIIPACSPLPAMTINFKYETEVD